jgi:hypothetical protein
MVVTTIKDAFQKATNPFRKPIDDRWGQYLSNDDRREIARYLTDKKDIIEPYFYTINKNNSDRVLDSIEQFARLKRSSVDLPTISQYFDMLENLDKIIEEIDKGFFNSLPKYNNVVKPDIYYMEIAFDIDGNPENQKGTLVNILKKLIGNVGARGYPVSYYNGTANFPIQYYMEFYPDRTHIRIFIHTSYIPPAVVGYLLYELNELDNKEKESIIPPSGQQYHIINNVAGIINNRIGIDIDQSIASYASQALWLYSLLYRFFLK